MFLHVRCPDHRRRGQQPPPHLLSGDVRALERQPHLQPPQHEAQGHRPRQCEGESPSQSVLSLCIKDISYYSARSLLAHVNVDGPSCSHFSNPEDGKFHVDVFLLLQKVSPQSQPEHLLWRLGGRADQEDLRDLRPAGRLAQGGLPAGQEDCRARGLEDEIEKRFNRKAHWHPSHSPHEWQRHRSSDSQGKL